MSANNALNKQRMQPRKKIMTNFRIENIQSEIETQSDDDKMEAELGCGSCTAQSKDCGECSAELRREISAEREYKCE